MSDLQDSSVEFSDLKRDLEGIKGNEKEKAVKLEAVEKEKDSLVAKVEKLRVVESSLRDELEGKEKEIQVLKKNVEELEAVVESSKRSEKLKNELENNIEKIKTRISILESSLDEKERLISAFETKDRGVLDSVNCDINGDAGVEGGNKGLIGGTKDMDWLVLGGSITAAVAVMGVACYVHASRKY